jgi:NADPH:quinone reductase-like Zn-dependent oxidoreductase
MREIVITKTGPPSVLQVRNSSDPTPSENEVRIRVKASGINFADLMARKGIYPDAPPLPAVVGYEVSGIVDMVGPGVDQTLLGKKVIGITRFGGYSDIVIVPLGKCFEIPGNLSFELAASIPVNYITAWQLIYHMGGLRKGQTILIQNAGSGVGLAAIDITIHLGGISIGTSSPGKHKFLKERGLNHCIDYRNDNVFDRVMEITNNRGVDLIIDPIGDDSWRENYKMLRGGGRLGAYGASKLTFSMEKNLFGKYFDLISFFLRAPRWSPLDLMADNKSVFGVNVLYLFDDPLALEWFTVILNGIKEGWVRPFVDACFSFDDASQAHQYIENRQNIGKVILVPTQELVAEFNKNKGV